MRYSAREIVGALLLGAAVIAGILYRSSLAPARWEYEIARLNRVPDSHRTSCGNDYHYEIRHVGDHSSEQAGRAYPRFRMRARQTHNFDRNLPRTVCAMSMQRAGVYEQAKANAPVDNVCPGLPKCVVSQDREEETPELTFDTRLISLKYLERDGIKLNSDRSNEFVPNVPPAFYFVSGPFDVLGTCDCIMVNKTGGVVPQLCTISMGHKNPRTRAETSEMSCRTSVSAVPLVPLYYPAGIAIIGLLGLMLLVEGWHCRIFGFGLRARLPR